MKKAAAEKKKKTQEEKTGGSKRKKIKEVVGNGVRVVGPRASNTRGCAYPAAEDMNPRTSALLICGVRSVRRDDSIVREAARLQIGAVIIGGFSPGSKLSTQH